tara:strand:+ start:306 stop:536 length:231 start_codon:yes stop_codon:yes gene_type:complete
MNTETFTLKFHPQQGWTKVKIIKPIITELPSDSELKLEKKKRTTKSYLKKRSRVWNNHSYKNTCMASSVFKTVRHF